jgi:hypothetical protein
VLTDVQHNHRTSPWLAGVALLWAAAAEALEPSHHAVLAQVPPVRHDEVQEILADPTFVARLRLEVVANPQVFIYLLDHPDINSALARALQIAPIRLSRVGPGRYQGDDGEWNSGTLDVLSAEGDRRVFLEQGVSRGWWFGSVAGRAVAAVDLSREGDRIRGEVQVWAKIAPGVLDRFLRVVAPVLGGLLDRKLQEQFGITFRVAEHASRDPARFCQFLAGIPEGSRDERQTLASAAACPGALPDNDLHTSAPGIVPPAISPNDAAWPLPQPRQE